MPSTLSWARTRSPLTATSALQIGVAPLRIDILTAIDAVQLEEAWADRVSATFAGEKVAVLLAHHLARNKRARWAARKTSPTWSGSRSTARTSAARPELQSL